MLASRLLQQLEQIYLFLCKDVSAASQEEVTEGSTVLITPYLIDELFDDEIKERTFFVSKEQLASVLNCSSRHILTILSKLVESECLDWIPNSGRGGRSTLIFKHSMGYYYRQQLDLWINNKELLPIQKLFQYDHLKIQNYILRYFGVKYLKAPKLSDHRCFSLLIPTCQQNQLELLFKPEFLYDSIEQLFQSALIRWIISCSFEPLINQVDGKFASSILRSWRMEHNTHWRFYVRSRILFHHLKPVTAIDIARSFIRLKEYYSCFDFIENIEVNSDSVLSVYLNRPCLNFPDLIAAFSPLVIEEEQGKLYGTGPYLQASKSLNNNYLLKRFDRYWSLFPEVEQIELSDFPYEWQRYIPIDYYQYPMCSQFNSSNNLLSDSIEEKISFDNCYAIYFNFQHNDIVYLKSKNSTALSQLTQWLRPELLLLRLLEKRSLFSQHLSIAHSLKYGRYDKVHHDQLNEQEKLLTFDAQQKDALNKIAEDVNTMKLQIGYWYNDQFCYELAILIQETLKEHGVSSSICSITSVDDQRCHCIIHHHMALDQAIYLYQLLTQFKGWMGQDLLYSFERLEYLCTNGGTEKQKWDCLSHFVTDGQILPLFHLRQKQQNIGQEIHFSNLFWNAFNY